MSEPSRITPPDVFALGTSSCIRLRHRMNVDFPHPEGPITAENECSRASILSFFKTWLFPYHALKSSVWTLLFLTVLRAGAILLLLRDSFRSVINSVNLTTSFGI